MKRSEITWNSNATDSLSASDANKKRPSGRFLFVGASRAGVLMMSVRDHHCAVADRDPVGGGRVHLDRRQVAQGDCRCGTG